MTRYEAFRRQFVIPPAKLDAVFKLAIQACRERTTAHVKLPAGEQFTVEYVKNKSWSGYNWYQGGFRSLIQVNTDLPIYIDRAVDLACHEGYPGHHVYNALLETAPREGTGLDRVLGLPAFLAAVVDRRRDRQLRHRGRFSRQGACRVRTAGSVSGGRARSSKAAAYYDAQALVDRLSYAGNEAARRYLNGYITRRRRRPGSNGTH